MLRAKQHIARYAEDRLPTNGTDGHGEAGDKRQWRQYCAQINSLGRYAGDVNQQKQHLFFYNNSARINFLERLGG